MSPSVNVRYWNLLGLESTLSRDILSPLSLLASARQVSVGRNMPRFVGLQ